MERTYNDKMFIDTFEHEFTYLNGFMRNVRRYGSRTALIDPETGVTLTYSQLNERANCLAHALRGDGTDKNDVVMTALRNCPEFAETYLAPRKLGAIVQFANYNLASGELALLIDHNAPKVFIYSANIADTVVKALKKTKHKPARIVMADNIEKAALPEGHTAYEDYTAGQSTEDPEMRVRPHIYDEVLRFCTSGTTALPKSVPVNDINEVLSAHDMIMVYSMKITDRTLNMTPFFHRGAAHIGGLCPCFYVGCSIVVMRAFDARKTLKWIEEYGITYITGAPSNLEMLSRQQMKKPRDISSLRGVVTMGAPFGEEACKSYMETLSPNIFNGYGTTETLTNCFLKPYDLPHGAGSIGGSVIDDDVRVVKVYPDKKAEPDEEVPKDGETRGEIIIHSPSKSTYSYYKNDETEKEKFYKGWMYTADTATWDENSLITVCGRKDDMMIVSGENIYPAQIEDALNSHPKVRDSIVTGVPDKDKYRGEVIAAYVVRDDERLTIAELTEYCASHPMLSEYKRPRYYAFIDSVPATATGKKQHYVARERAEQDLKDGILKRKD